jgi:ATP-dependent DNA helicase RecQ
VHVADVLRGSKSEKVVRWGHDNVSTYGIGMDLSQKQWLHLSRQLLQQGYLQQEGEYRTLSLTIKATDALRDRSPIMGQLEQVEARPRNASARQTELDYNPALFSLLRQKRKELADEAGVPPYVIFSDRTLVEMAAYFPQSAGTLLDISGVGQVKARQYGKVFGEVIRAYCEKHGIAERPHPGPSPTRKEVTAERSGQRYVFVGEAYNAGESVQSLMQRYQVTAGTILDHLGSYAAAGNPLRNGEDLWAFSSASPDEQATVFEAFDALGPTYLKPAFDRLEGRVSYDELKILRLLYLTR